MNGAAWLRSLGTGIVPDPAAPKPVDWLDVLVDFQARHPGRGAASRALADAFGVNVRSAQRWLSLNGRPTRTREHKATAEQLRSELGARRQAAHEERRAAAARRRRHAVADLLAVMDDLDVGTVLVVPKSARAGNTSTRRIGRLTGMAPGMALVAAAWRRGDVDTAELELSDSILARYDQGRQGDPTNRDGLAALLYIVDYQDGIAY